jgi:hypothetical protein
MKATNSWQRANYSLGDCSKRGFSLFTVPPSRDRLSLIVRTLQHTGLPHPVLSSPTSMDSFLSEIPCETSEKRDQFGSGKNFIQQSLLQNSFAPKA